MHWLTKAAREVEREKGRNPGQESVTRKCAAKPSEIQGKRVLAINQPQRALPRRTGDFAVGVHRNDGGSYYGKRKNIQERGDEEYIR